MVYIKQFVFLQKLLPLLSLKTKFMFGIFKKKTEKEKLQEQYAKLQKEAFELSKTNRKLSDEKAYEADLVMKQIEKMT
jgi:hypothetical protein